MRQQIRKVIRRVIGLEALEARIADLQQGLAETKDRVSVTQGQASELLSQTRGKQRKDLARQLDSLGLRCLAAEACPEGEAAALSQCYAQAADLVTKHWGGDGWLPPDPYPDDDFTLSYAVRQNIFVPGVGNDEQFWEDERHVPWRELFYDPDCGVFLLLGQSNAANHGERPYSSKEAVYSWDFLRFRCVRASDPLGGASGSGGSTWSRLGDLLVQGGVFRRVLFVPLASAGNFITDLIPGGNKHGRTSLALSRLVKASVAPPLPISAVLWQQGEAEANHTDMSASVYQAHLRDIAADLRNRGVFAPMFVAAATHCEAGPHPFHNAEQIRHAQLSIADQSAGIFPGPDVDTIVGPGRYDQCHLSESGLRRCAELWFETLAPRRALLLKSADGMRASQHGVIEA